MPVGNSRPVSLADVKLYHKYDLPDVTFSNYLDLKQVRNNVKVLEGIIEKEKALLARDTGLAKDIGDLWKDYGDDAVVRYKQAETDGKGRIIKSARFKVGSGSGFVKRLLCGDRYKSEIKAAAVPGVGGGSSVVAVAKEIVAVERAAKHRLDENIDNLKLHSDRLLVLEKADRKAAAAKERIRVVAVKQAKEKAAKEQDEKMFSIIYQSNVGCKGINEIARRIYANGPLPYEVSGSQVVSEYNERFTNAFTRATKDLPVEIKVACKNLGGLVRKYAVEWYKPNAVRKTTYRGQGMNDSGLDRIREDFTRGQRSDEAVIYNVGQFFSTSSESKVAIGYCPNKSKGRVRVLFELVGNSGRPFGVSNGLGWQNRESERIYSPLANFKVVSIDESNLQRDKLCIIELEEVTSNGNYPTLPY